MSWKVSEHYWEKGEIIPKMLIFLFEGEGDREGTIAQKLWCPPKNISHIFSSRDCEVLDS